MSPLGEAPNGPSGEGLEVEEGDQHFYWWAGPGLKVCLFQEGHLPSGPWHFDVLVGSFQSDLMCPALTSFPSPRPRSPPAYEVPAFFTQSNHTYSTILLLTF